MNNNDKNEYYENIIKVIFILKKLFLNNSINFLFIRV